MGATYIKPKDVSFGKLPDKNTNSNAGKNSITKEFVEIGELILNNYQTFTEQDFISLSRGKDLPIDTLMELFKIWIAELIKADKVVKIPSFYDRSQGVYQVLTK